MCQLLPGSNPHHSHVVVLPQLQDTGGQALIPEFLLQPQHHQDIPGLVAGGLWLLVLQQSQHHQEVFGLGPEGGVCSGLEPNGHQYRERVEH